MKFNSCSMCGSINETATIKLNKLKKKIDRRIDLKKYGSVEERYHAEPLENELWEWSEAIKEVLGEL